MKYGAAAVRIDPIAARARIVRETERETVHAASGKSEIKFGNKIRKKKGTKNFLKKFLKRG